MIVPAINCQEFSEVKERFHVAQEILFGGGSEAHQTGEHEGWIHIDIADGGFTNGYSTWRNAKEFAQLKRHPNLKVEVHVMVNEPEPVIGEWLSLGVNRVIFHLESTDNVEAIASMCKESGVSPVLALKPETPVAHAAPYMGLVEGCQILAVEPGPGKQEMQPMMIEKIVSLRKAYPGLLIEVDGGIIPATASRCIAAGADQLVSGSYIFSDENPAAAYQRLAGQ